MIAYLGPQSFSSRKEIVDYWCSKNQQSMFALDIETPTLRDRTPIGLGVAVSPSEAFYFSMEPLDEEFPWELIQNPEIKKIWHNCLFDLPALAEYEPAVENTEDTMIMARLACEPAILHELADKLGIEDYSMEDVLLDHNVKSVRDLPVEVTAKKCMQDVQATFAAYEYLYHKVDLDYYGIEMALIPILMKMSKVGLKIDQVERSRLEVKYQEEREFYRKVCIDAEIMNPASPAQVGFILAKRGNILPMRRRKETKTGKWKMKLLTEAAELEKLNDPLASAVISFRHANKVLGTYLKPAAALDRMYGNWHLEAATGRVSSTRRNLQNWEIGLRTIFVPDSNYFTTWDASQIELRILTYFSRDDVLRKIYETGGDIHQETADYLHIPRKIAKNVNFAMIYGGDDQTLASTAHIASARRCRELREGWMDKYPDAAHWISTTQRQALEDGYVTTMYGRRLPLPVEIESPEDVKRKAVNYPIQGSAAEIIKRVMIRCRDLPLVLQVHDELIADGDVQEEVKDMHLEQMAPFHQPFKIQMIDRWGTGE